MVSKSTFCKEERLKSSQTIQELLQEGKPVSRFPFKIYWKESDGKPRKFPARIAITVPKRKFKRAVDRNLLKRKIRESYRQNKTIIYDPLLEKNMNIVVIILYLSDEFLSFDSLDAAISELLHKLAENLQE